MLFYAGEELQNIGTAENLGRCGQLLILHTL
jgi:hypothetical protein